MFVTKLNTSHDSTGIRALAEKYRGTFDGSWLDDFDWRGVPVNFTTRLPKDVVGRYWFGRIELMSCCDPRLIFPTYIHELRHRWQWCRHPFKYMIGKIYRPLIEDDARCQELAAENWVYSKEKYNGKEI